MGSGKGQAGKSFTPLLGVLAALAMGVAAVAIVLQMQEREKRLAKERELQLSLAENEDLTFRVEELQQTRGKLEETLSQLRKELSRSHEELTQAVEQQQTFSRSLEERDQQLGQLKQTLEQAQQESQRVTAQVAELERERTSLKAQLEELETARGELETKFNELSQPAVELGTVVVSGDEPPAAAEAISPASPGSRVGIDGQVVVVNREYDFIVMNLGRNHGLSVGQEFQILRDNQVLGRVKVEKVYDELSAAAILPESQKQSIREGDAVRAL